MKYFIVYLSSASKIEIEEYVKFENGLARKAELNAQMIPARLINGVDLSTELAQEAHKRDMDLLAAVEASNGPEDSEELGADVEGDEPASDEALEVELKKEGLVDGDVQTLPETDVTVTGTESHDPDLHSHGNEVDAKTVVEASH